MEIKPFLYFFLWFPQQPLNGAAAIKESFALTVLAVWAHGFTGQGTPQKQACETQEKDSE